jgi:hypothetical protein
MIVYERLLSHLCAGTCYLPFCSKVYFACSYLCYVRSYIWSFPFLSILFDYPLSSGIVPSFTIHGHLSCLLFDEISSLHVCQPFDMEISIIQAIQIFIYSDYSGTNKMCNMMIFILDYCLIYSSLFFSTVSQRQDKTLDRWR